MLADQQAKTEVTILAEVTDLDYYKEVGLLLYNEGRKHTYRNKGDSLGNLLVL